MLISLEVENFRSFKNRAVFHMLQRNYKRFTEHVVTVNDNLSILKTSGIYGSNGSGKSNLFKCLYYLKKVVESSHFLRSVEAIKNFTPFKLDDLQSGKPIKIELDILIDNFVYSYKINFNSELHIIYEELFKVVNGEVQLIFKRHENNAVDFPSNPALETLKIQLSQALLPQTSILCFDLIKDIEITKVSDWFKTKIDFLFPTYEFDDIAYILSLKNEYLQLANNIIKPLNLGIDELKINLVPISIYLGLDNKDIITQISAILQKKTHHSFKDNMGDYCTALKNEKGEILIAKLVCIHYGTDGSIIEFDVDQESRGTIVLLHLIPALIRSYGEGVNYFIDDINTSLHPILLREILGQYLSFNLGNAKGQLIFNSHEDLLMDERIVRQDEIWLTEKKNGISDIFPLSDFPNIRFDLNLRKNYLNGKFGGVPFEHQPDKLNFGGK
ncbi:hypothetical protein SAMN06265349_1011271 [Flavobacterium resistens]|uniref:AAA family ATPase n=1 Tax=Flavobacterium resistens TaxID=443612 RepID=A0A521BNS6_9FLAO|nr:ATP-binding protein [Flavobacterium resistens]MRX67576.1 AAA family ATPase [Flavobacterium resistens]SMO48817.1 hypothetical protein SAMN06265349_1011271 [Flavobacterium resistens]